MVPDTKSESVDSLAPNGCHGREDSPASSAALVFLPLLEGRTAHPRACRGLSVWAQPGSFCY